MFHCHFLRSFLILNCTLKRPQFTSKSNDSWLSRRSKRIISSSSREVSLSVPQEEFPSASSQREESVVASDANQLTFDWTVAEIHAPSGESS